MLWEEMNSEQQVRLYWDYCATIPDYDEEPVSFSEFDEMMQGYVF